MSGGASASRLKGLSSALLQPVECSCMISWTIFTVDRSCHHAKKRNTSQVQAACHLGKLQLVLVVIMMIHLLLHLTCEGDENSSNHESTTRKPNTGVVVCSISFSEG